MFATKGGCEKYERHNKDGEVTTPKGETEKNEL